ncbi:MAG: DUF1571 domain-containing protein, partial [Planctomycetes bacterium]|nr:DUF1571 domain-containing protein [Planctomycetota bacterium]
MTFLDLRCRGAFALAVLIAGPVTLARADDSATAPRDTSTHPLASTVRYATARYDYIRKNVRDYSCLLIKRERIDGELQDYRYLRTLVRREQTRGGRVVRPMAVFMQHTEPGKLNGRRLLYVDGRNDGKVLVRKGGGGAFNYLKLKIDPHGAAARRESNYPITDVGLAKMVERLIERAKADIKHDPTGANTRVSYFRNAKVNDRVCTHIRVVHPKRGAGIDFHRASLYVDDKLRVPIRVVVYGWPSR